MSALPGPKELRDLIGPALSTMAEILNINHDWINFRLIQLNRLELYNFSIFNPGPNELLGGPLTQRNIRE